MDPETYCREIETYLCRKNDGHLVRVVGPAFEVVTGWVARGVPFKVACRGIDRYFDRYYAKGPRRRPVRVEFCDADVLDAFDEWRRAVGVGMAGGQPGSAEDAASPVARGGPEGEAAGAQHKPGQSLRAHLDRAVMRLTDLQAGGELPPGLQAIAERLLGQFAQERTASRTLRGEARDAYLHVLEARDGELLDAAREATPAEARARIEAEAADELSGYRGRMPQDAYERAVRAAADKLVRDHWKLPAIAYGQG